MEACALSVMGIERLVLVAGRPRIATRAPLPPSPLRRGSFCLLGLWAGACGGGARVRDRTDASAATFYNHAVGVPCVRCVPTPNWYGERA